MCLTLPLLCCPRVPPLSPAAPTSCAPLCPPSLFVPADPLPFLVRLHSSPFLHRSHVCFCEELQLPVTLRAHLLSAASAPASSVFFLHLSWPPSVRPSPSRPCRSLGHARSFVFPCSLQARGRYLVPWLPVKCGYGLGFRLLLLVKASASTVCT